MTWGGCPIYVSNLIILSLIMGVSVVFLRNNASTFWLRAHFNGESYRLRLLLVMNEVTRTVSIL